MPSWSLPKSLIANAICFPFDNAFVCAPFVWTETKAGSAMLARMAMIEMTTSNSMRVNAVMLFFFIGSKVCGTSNRRKEGVRQEKSFCRGDGRGAGAAYLSVKIAYRPRKRTFPERCLMLSQSENGYERLVNEIDSLTRRSFLFLLPAIGRACRHDSAGPRRVDPNCDAHCHSRL